MRNSLIKTKNVKRFISLMDNLQKAPSNVAKMALVYGTFGLGKSQTIMWWVTNNDAIYIRCNHNISPKWLLTEIVKELDEVPCYTSQRLFEQIEDNLKHNTVFIPVVNMDVSAGFGSLTEEIESTKDFVSFGKDWIKKHISANVNNLVMFTVRGDSMDGGNSRIKNGSQIIVDTSVKEYINDGIYAIRIENALFVKRLQYMPGKLLVKSDNPIYQPFEVDLKTDSVNIIGAVVYVMNDMSCI